MASNCYLLQNTTKAKRLKISLKEDFIIGRKELKPIGLVTQVSRKHALFHVGKDGNWSVKDLKSTNGVYVNKEKVGSEFHPLKNGDVVGFGVAPEFGEFDLLFCSSNSCSPSSKSDVNDCRPSSHVKPITCHLDSSNNTSAIENSSVKKQSLHSEQKYSHILKSEFPKVVVKKCEVSESKNIFQGKKLSLDDHEQCLLDETQPVKRQKIIEISDSSDSDSEVLLIDDWASDRKHSDFTASVHNVNPRMAYMSTETTSCNVNKQIVCNRPGKKSIETPSPCGMQLGILSLEVPHQIVVQDELKQNFVSANNNSNFVASSNVQCPVAMLQPFTCSETTGLLNSVKPSCNKIMNFAEGGVASDRKHSDFTASRYNVDPRLAYVSAEITSCNINKQTVCNRPSKKSIETSSPCGMQLGILSLEVPNRIVVQNELKPNLVSANNNSNLVASSSVQCPVAMLQPFTCSETTDMLNSVKTSYNKVMNFAEGGVASAAITVPEVKLKTEVHSPQSEAVSVKSEKYSDSDDECKIVSYSEDYEVILISDDEDYFSIPSSQLANDLVNVKSEPQDDEIEELNQNFEYGVNPVNISSSPCMFTIAGVQSLRNDCVKGVPQSGERIENCIENNSASCMTTKSISSMMQGNALPDPPEKSSSQITSVKDAPEKSSSQITSVKDAVTPYRENLPRYAVNDSEQLTRDNDTLSKMQHKHLQNLEKTSDPKLTGRSSQCQQRKDEEDFSAKKQSMEPRNEYLMSGCPSSNKNAINNAEIFNFKTGRSDNQLEQHKEELGHKIPVILMRGRKHSNETATPVSPKKKSAMKNNVFNAQSLGEKQPYELGEESNCNSSICRKNLREIPVQPSCSTGISLAAESRCSVMEKSTPESVVFRSPEFPNNYSNELPRVSSLNASRSPALHDKHIEPSRPPEKAQRTTVCQDQERGNFSSKNSSGKNTLPTATVRPITAPSSTKTSGSETLPSIQIKTTFTNNDVNHRSVSIQPLTEFESRDPRLQPRVRPENIKPCKQNHSSKDMCSENFQGSSSMNITCSKPELIDFDVLVAEIVRWNPAWLRQYVECKSPPPSIAQGAVPIPLHFDSFRDYVSCFYSLIRLEIWESIFRCWKESTMSTVFFMVTKSEPLGDLMILECESVITSNTPQAPHNGFMMIIDLRVCRRKEAIKVFGYVTSHSIVSKPTGTSLHQEWRQYPEIHDETSKFLVFTLKMKKIPISIDLNKLMKASVMSYVASHVRVVSTFQHMLSSPVTPCILHPTIGAYCITTVSQSRFHGLLGHYNERQKTAVLSICHEVQLPNTRPKIILLKGPPGTGKTHTIVGIIQALHSKKHQVKILVTAPSNAAVDEIARRLIVLRQISESSSSLSDLRIIRVGPIQSIHKSVLPFTLEEQTRHNIKRSLKKAENSLQTDFDNVTQDISLLVSKIEEMEAKKYPLNDITQRRNELTMKTRCKQNIARELADVTAKYADLKPSDDYKLKMEILAKADVILTTLGSCGLKILESVFGQKSDHRFSCCIVDEVTQGIEPLIFQPLVFGITKFILVGDHQQLPANIHSKLAATCHFERSFCERVHSFFQVNHQRSPVYMLNTQYRMHSDICAFPSTNFYSNVLITARGVDSNYSSFPFKPFIMLDIVHEQDDSSRSYKPNAYDAEATLEICKQLIEFIPKDYSIGIITPYLSQKHTYQNALPGYSKTDRVEINTVDGFQGREKDVIILPCVRTSCPTATGGFLTCTKRMNVAITRAKQCLIICGHMKSLKHYPVWTNLISYAKSKRCRVPITDNEQISHVLNKMKKGSLN